MSRFDFDVILMGGGLAGGLLARQLIRQRPELRVLVIEKRREGAYKVGESTVEIFSDYLLRKLGLSTYLYDEHLPKNGLRFFFDDEDRSAPLERLSEIGSQGLPWLPSFQIDRRRFETDLRRFDEEAGVSWEEARVTGFELGEDGHRVMLERAGRPSCYTARWLVDASGRAGLVARRLGWRVPDVSHAITGAWARLEGVAEWDDGRSEAFHRRARHTSRRLSTNHFCYPGYWIWFIPLRGGLTSVGVVGERDRLPASLARPAGFRSFLDEHRAVRELLAPATAIDFGTYGQLAYGTRRFLDPRRVALIGEAAAFTDPFYSPGSDFIALENDIVTDLVVRELGGEDPSVWSSRLVGYEEFLQGRFELNLALYRALYPLLGSFRLFRLKWDLDLTAYYDLWLSSYRLDEHLDPRALRAQRAERPFVSAALVQFNRALARAGRLARADGSYFEDNRDRFLDALATIDFVREVGQPRSMAAVREILLQSFRRARRHLASAAGTRLAEGGPEPDLEDFVEGRAFAAL